MRYGLVLWRGLTVNAIRLRQYLRHPWGLKNIYADGFMQSQIANLRHLRAKVACLQPSVPQL
jgi:hypothetical protein